MVFLVTLVLFATAGLSTTQWARERAEVTQYQIIVRHHERGIELFECSHPDQTDGGQCRFTEELVFRVTQGRYSIIIGIRGKNICRVVAHGAWTGSTRSNGFFDIIWVIDMLDHSVTDQFGAQWCDKSILIVDFFDEGRSRTFRSDGGIHWLFVTHSLCSFKWRGRGIRRCMTQRGHYR